MIVSRFKQLQKEVSEFRSQALLGRYQKAIAVLDSLILSIAQLAKINTNSKITLELAEVQKMIRQEGNAVRQLSQKYLEKPIVLKSIDKTAEKGSEKSAILKEPKPEVGKWGASALFQNKSAVYTPSSTLPTHPTIEQFINKSKSTLKANISVEDFLLDSELVQQKLVLPFTMPQFFKRVEAKTVLLYGPVDLREVVRAIAQRTGCTLLQPDQQTLAQMISNKEMNTLAQALDAGNTIAVLPKAEDFDVLELAKLIGKVKDSKFVKGLLILTSNQPWGIQKDIINAVSLTIRVKAEKGKQPLYDQFEQELNQSGE